ncbi:DUF1850 domain-containing protein [Tindallia californiensis]|uniref:DUF1850 domain-containing protein n=1 Tax=Tindallia californiensis TaxID=159292 RepID=A0A1H3K6D0_9FIRM|nr:DUF1850 domain-containing protein [Tindallia californiensis]SDY47736.1 hypothetical protein SAMN05192546_102244 [Tindallia californiensis]
MRRHLKLLLHLLILILMLQWPVFYLQASDYQEGRILYRHPIKLDENIQIMYHHSVEKTPVIEFFKAMPDQRLLLTGQVYESYGAGLPTRAEGLYEVEEGFFKITGINMIFESLLYRTEPETSEINFKLIIKEKEIPFHFFSKERTLVELKIKRAPIWLFWIREWQTENLS